MKILLLDAERTGLPFAMRSAAAGHDVRHWLPPEKGSGEHCRVGDGIVTKVLDWRPSMKWADLILLTDNTKYTSELRPFFTQGFPILGTTEEAAELELDRVVGQKVMSAAGMEILPYKEFSSYDDAAAWVKKQNKPFVSKPWGGASDKNLSYVPSTAADLIERLMRWKKEKLKGKFILQEKIDDGFEMGVGAWFGPGGFSHAIEENWEHKKLMNDDLGPTTGEMGTIMRYVSGSKLFREVLEPLEEELAARRFVGSVDINCMVDKHGTPWPLEFTCRLGWPAFNLNMAMHLGDPAEWMVDLLEGRDTLRVRKGVCCGVVMAMGDFPWDRDPPGRNDGWPIRGLDEATLPYTYLTMARRGRAWVDAPDGPKEEEGIVTAGSYVCVVCNHGDTVEAAREATYGVVEKIGWPPHKVYRTDIGARLEKCLPGLQKHGFAAGMEYD